MAGPNSRCQCDMGLAFECLAKLLLRHLEDLATNLSVVSV